MICLLKNMHYKSIIIFFINLIVWNFDFKDLKSEHKINLKHCFMHNKCVERRLRFCIHLNLKFVY